MVVPECVDSVKGFHIDCYQRFIAISKKLRDKIKVSEESSPSVAACTLRSQVKKLASPTSSGVLPKICVFCTKKDKKHNGVKQKLVRSESGQFEVNIKKYATWLGDSCLLAKLGTADFEALNYVIMQYVVRSTRREQKKLHRERRRNLRKLRGTKNGTVLDLFMRKPLKI